LVKVGKKARASRRPFYLKKITVRNVRCFEHVEIHLDSANKPRMWGVMFGDNGVGKTTLLRCISMGLCDMSSAAGLLREIYGEWNRHDGRGAVDAEIIIDFFPLADGTKPQIKTKITSDPSGYSQVTQQTRPKKFPWGRIFACGYGAARRAFGTKDIDDYSTIDAVYSLFNYDAPLQNPELVIRRMQGHSSERRVSTAKDLRFLQRRARESLDAIALMLTPGALQLTKGGLSIRGPWGNFQPVGGLGDGYQATLAWILDLIGWAMLFREDGRPARNISGIVLVDELEQHLHPRWQRKIIGLLRKQFPRIQFIVTTHTPMCAIGTTELSDSECELIVLERTGDAVKIAEDIKPPRNRWADQVLTSRLFMLPTAGDEHLLEETTRYNQLQVKSRLTASEKREAAIIRRTLQKALRAPNNDFESTIERAVMATLEQQAALALDRVAARFEVRRKIQALRA
jgi:AAA domain, putative AbiEii toxin, Type IV TA system/AAA domain